MELKRDGNMHLDEENGQKFIVIDNYKPYTVQIDGVIYECSKAVFHPGKRLSAGLDIPRGYGLWLGIPPSARLDNESEQEERHSDS